MFILLHRAFVCRQTFFNALFALTALANIRRFVLRPLIFRLTPFVCLRSITLIPTYSTIYDGGIVFDLHSFFENTNRSETRAWCCLLKRAALDVTQLSALNHSGCSHVRRVDSGMNVAK